MNPQKIDPHTYAGPLEDIEKQEGGNAQKGPMAAIVIGILVLLLAGGIFAYLFASGELEVSEGGDIASTFIPLVWIVIFLPFIAIKKKQQQTAEVSTSQNKALVFLVFGIAVLVMMTGLIVFLVSS